jgi:hypothetical protein
VHDFRHIAELHDKISPALHALALDQAAIRYFAGSVIRSRMFQMQQRKDADRYIHTIAFVTHQYYRMHDNLVDIFLKCMTSFQSTVTREKNDIVAEQQEKQASAMKGLVKEFDQSVIGLIQSIRHIAHDQGMSDHQKIVEIQNKLSRKSFHKAETIQSDKFLFPSAYIISNCEIVWTDYQVPFHPALSG